MRRAVAVVALLILLAACGSTTKQKQTADKGPNATSAASLGSSASGSPGATSGPGGKGGTSSTGTITGGGGNGAPLPGGGTGPITLSGTVQIGAAFTSDQGAVFSSFGVNNNGSHDTSNGAFLRVLKPLVDRINATGGIARHKLVVLPHGVASLNGNFATQSQGICTDFTEDHHVFAVISAALIPKFDAADCLMEKKTPLVWEFEHFVDDPHYAHYGKYLYTPYMPSADRMGFFVDQLYSHGFFGSHPTIGVLRNDDSVSKRFLDIKVKPGLAKHGWSVAVDHAVTPANAAGDAGSVAASIANAVVKFKNAHVTHVLILPSDGVNALLYQQVSEDQGYHAHQGLTSFDAPYLAAENAKQMPGAMVPGFSPLLDVETRDYPKDLPAQKLCMALARKGGSTTPDDMLPFCDGLFFLQAALAHTTTLSADALQAGVNAIGTSWTPTMTFRAKLGPRHDGPAAIRMATWQSSCSCFRYSSGDIAIP